MIDRWRGDPIVLTSKRWRFRSAMSASGGAMNIPVLLPWADRIVAEDDNRGVHVARYGISCGALVAAMMATRQLPLLRELVDATATSWSVLRIPGVSRLAPWSGGAYDLVPLRRQLEERWQHRRMVEPLIVGVVRRGGLYHDVVIGPDTPKKDAVAAIVASCAIAPIFAPVRWRGGLYVDGGHVVMAPVPYGARRVRVGLTRPLYEPEGHEPGSDSLLGALGWMLEASAVSGLRTSLAILHRQAALGALVDVWAPEDRVGGRLEATAAVRDARYALGERMVLAGPTRLLGVEPEGVG